LSELAVVLKDIDADGHQLLAFERSEQKDFAVVQKIADDILKTGALSVRLQALVKQAHFAQARTLDLRQQEPLLLSTIAAVTQFGTIEQTEGASDTAQTQQDSGRSILFVFALTTLGVLLSIILAIILHAH
jgi:hypothetical protein